MAQYSSPFVIHALKVCREEHEVVSNGFKALYNFCFMCEVGYLFLLENTDILEFIEEAKVSSVFSDDVVQRECRRLELALKPDGWRGNVELTIAKEIAEDRRRFESMNASTAVPPADDSPSKAKKKKELVLLETFNGKFFRNIASANQDLVNKKL